MAWENSVIVTGGTANLGYQTALNIAKSHPNYLVVISSRSDKDQAAAAINSATGHDNVVFVPIDLSKVESVRNYAKQWAMQERPPIQSLVFNAAMQFPRELRKTSDGIESTFAISHVGHALLFHLLWPYLSNNARIVVVSSGTHDPALKSGLPDAIYNSAEHLAHPPPDMIDIPGRQRYASTKLANILWVYALEHHLAKLRPHRNITVNAMDPGLMPATGLVREGTSIEKFLWKRVLPHIVPLVRVLLTTNIHTPVQSGAALARLAVGTDVEGETGKYYEGLKPIRSSKDSYDTKKQEDLWNWTVDFLATSDEERTRFDRLQ